MEKEMIHRHAMIDVETFGTGERAIVASIGAVSFTEDDVDEKGSFYMAPSWQQQITSKGTVTEGTLRFWLRQPDAQREVLLRTGMTGVSATLKALTDWFSASFGKDKFLVWAKGPQFDLALVGSLYDRWFAEKPWEYWQERCVRTALMHRATETVGPPKGNMEHHALDDAVHQAMQVQAFLRALHLPYPTKKPAAPVAPVDDLLN
jgi:hypothetical protein